MSIYKTYLKKNNTLIFNSNVNTSKNQVTEIVYGGLPNNIYSRYIFKIDIDKLKNFLTEKEIPEQKILSHNLKLFNTINGLDGYSGEYIDNSKTRKRATSFKLILFNIEQDWDEGVGYEMLFNKLFLDNPDKKSPSNWFESKTDENWVYEGAYSGDTNSIISVIDFDNGDENIDVDITNYINDIISETIPNYGLGFAFSSEFENSNTENLYSVGFHSKYTTTIFEPYLETKLDNIILDDRNNFKLDEDNRLYFYAKRGQKFLDVDMLNVRIYNHKYEQIDIIEPNEIYKHSKGVYYINLNLSSDNNLDSVLYTDEWIFEINNEQKSIRNEFYLIENKINGIFETVIPKNVINISYSGILNKQRIKRGNEIIIDLILKKLYNQNNSNPLNLEYRIYIPQLNNRDLEVIPFTRVNRAPNKYFIKLYTEIFIPSIYRMELKLSNVDYNLSYEPIEFTIID